MVYGAVRPSPVSQLIRYAYDDLITHFHILSKLETFYQSRAFKFGTVKALNKPINVILGLDNF